MRENLIASIVERWKSGVMVALQDCDADELAEVFRRCEELIAQSPRHSAQIPPCFKDWDEIKKAGLIDEAERKFLAEYGLWSKVEPIVNVVAANKVKTMRIREYIIGVMKALKLDAAQLVGLVKRLNK